MTTTLLHPFPTPSQAHALAKTQAAYLGARKDYLVAVEGFALHFLELFALKTPIMLAINEQSSDFDDQGHSYGTVTDRMELDDSHPLRRTPEWAWLDDTSLASECAPCGDFLDDLHDILHEGPPEITQGPNGESLTVKEWLAATLGLSVDYIGEALGAISTGQMEAYARLEEDGAPRVTISEVI